MLNTTSLSTRVYREFEKIYQYDVEVKFVEGKANLLADTISRSRIQIMDKDEGISLEKESSEKDTIGFISIASCPKIFLDLAKSQQKDATLQQMIQDHPNSLELIKRKIWGSNLELIGDISMNKFRAYVTKDMRHRFFKHFHDKAHLGINKSLAIIKNEVIWSNMRKDVITFVRCCDICNKNKVYRHEKRALKICKYPSGRFQTIQADFFGPLPEIDQYKFVLIIICRDTRFCIALPCRSQTTDELIQKFKDGWLQYYGVPQYFVSDNGAAFCSQKFEDFLKIIGTIHRKCLAYQSNENGLSERWVGWIKVCLRSQELPQLWLENLAWVMLNLRSSISDDGLSPNQAVYGEQLRLPGFLFETEQRHFPEQFQRDLFNMARSFQTRRFRKHPIRPNFENNRLKNAKMVYVRHMKKQPALLPRYAGPFHLVKINGKTAVILKRGKKRIVSVTRLKVADLLPIEMEDKIDLFQRLNIDPNSTDPETDSEKDENDQNQEYLSNQNRIKEGTKEGSEKEKDQNEQEIDENDEINPQLIDASSSESENDERISLPGNSQNRLTRQRIDSRPQRNARVPRRFDDFVMSNIICDPKV